MKWLLGLLPLALLPIPVAQADQYDYVARLDSQGVYYENILDVIELGKQSCHYLRQGHEVIDVLTNVYNHGYAKPESGVIVQAAVEEMCPDEQATLQAFIDKARA